jgi:hypothetical protein
VLLGKVMNGEERKQSWSSRIRTEMSEWDAKISSALVQIWTLKDLVSRLRGSLMTLMKKWTMTL